uniref:putative signal transducing protein n=1 Tax=uncultured Sphingomonas sp. TaxID=158754 RepID=UPI0035CC104D
MSLVELGRFDRNEAHIVIGRLESEGIFAVAFDGNASIADGSAFFIAVRVMVDDEDLDAARRIIGDTA